jgi:WD40 repeat protein
VLTVAEFYDEDAKLWDAETGQQLRIFHGHSKGVDSITFSLDGRRVLTGGGDNTAKLWDAETGEQIRVFYGHSSTIESVAFSPDGSRLLTGSFDRTAKLWDAETGQELRTFRGHSGVVFSVAFSPDGHRVLTGSDDGTAKLWDAQTGQEIRTYSQKSSGSAESVAFSPDGRTVMTGSEDGSARLWDAETGQVIRTFHGHSGLVWSVFSPDGRTVMTGSEDDTAKLWDAETGQVIRTLAGHSNWVTSIAFSPDGRRVLTGSRDGAAKLWDVETGQEIRTFHGHNYGVKSVAFSPDGDRVLTGSEDGTTKLWDARNGHELGTLVSFIDGSWAVVDPEGRFDTNDLDGSGALHWVMPDQPMRALPLEIFMRDYYTPRLLPRIMNRETLPPVRSIDEIENRVQPDVAIISINASRDHLGRADVVVRAASRIEQKKTPDGKVVAQASGLEDLRLFRNGQLIGYREGALRDGDFTFSNIQLLTSANSATFTAYAFNAERIKSATAQKEYAYDQGVAAKPHAYLLQIGVNHYQASGCELHGSATDAEQLSQALSDRMTKRGLEVSAVRLVSTDTQTGATKQKIRDALKAIAAKATPDDVFFLSFSGHGYGDKNGQFYILPSDIQGSCSRVDDKLLKGAITADELAEWLRPIDAGEMSFVLDSCDSASSVESNDFKPGPMGSRGLGQLAYDKRMRILAASQSNQAAHESESLHQGLLSYALTEEGLVEGKADWKPVDQRITVGEWLSYAADEVPRIRENGEVKTGRGIIPIGQPLRSVSSDQIPAIFDFSKKDTFVLQQVEPSSSP